jgi:hypothetical protein
MKMEQVVRALQALNGRADARSAGSASGRPDAP